MVFDKGQWRAQTRAEKAREGLQLLAAEGGNGGESSSGGEGAGADGASGEGGGEERNPRTIPGATDQPKQSDSANPAGKNRPLLTPTTTKPVNIADAHKEFNFNAEGAKEEITAILNPYDAYRANELSYSVPEKVRKLQDDRKLPPEGRNNETDAVRHTLWNYEMTKTFGAKEAKKIGDAHERGAIRNIFKKDGSGPNDESERLMDLHNNKVGRELALDPKNKARSSTDVVLDALKKGKLRTKPFKVQTPPPGLLPRNWLAN
jgi:hypothetical protein